MEISLILLEQAFESNPSNALTAFITFKAITHLPEEKWQQGFALIHAMVEKGTITCEYAFKILGPSYAKENKTLLRELTNQANVCLGQKT